MNLTRFQRTTRVVIAGMAVAALALSVASASPVQAAGLRNCNDITGGQLVGCWELVWSDGVQYRMTFSNLHYDGATPRPLDPFYVVAPQTSAPQGYNPIFLHDHVTGDIPTQNHGDYSVKLQGFFVFCSAVGIGTGACVPTWLNPGFGTVPFATTVNGQPLTSTGAIESAAAAGLVTLINLGPHAVIVGTISGN